MLNVMILPSVLLLMVGGDLDKPASAAPRGDQQHQAGGGNHLAKLLAGLTALGVGEADGGLADAEVYYAAADHHIYRPVRQSGSGTPS